MKSAALLLILLTIPGLSAGLRAQSLGDWYSRGIIRQQTVNLIIARQKSRDYDANLGNLSRTRIVIKPGKFPPGTQPKNPPGPTTTSGRVPSDQTTTFRPVEPAFVPQQLAARMGKTPQEQQYIEDLLTKCLDFYTQTARQKGIPLYDVARALNYYISTNYFIYSEGAGPTKAQMDKTRAVISSNIVQDQNFRRMSDREKQESYETLIVIAGFVDLGYGTAKQSGNQNLAAQFHEMARHNLETLLSSPIDKIRFTDDGLVLN